MGSIQGQVKTTSTDDDDEANCLFALQLASSSVLPMVLRAVVELNVFEIISKEGTGGLLSAKEIADKISTKNSNATVMLDRILYLLVSHSVLTCYIGTYRDGKAERRYGLAPVSKYFLQNEDGVSLASLVLSTQDKVYMDSWYHLKDAVVEGGIPFNKVHGVHAFEYPGTDPRFNEIFNRAMVDHTTIIMKKILETYKGFENLKEVVDVGGGLGTMLKIITSNYPTLKGINFDLPHVIQHAPSYPNVEHIGGDMFTSVPRGEAIFMKWILHDWGDEQCSILLKNCYEALPENGKLIVVEAILPLVPETNDAGKGLCQIDLVMLAQFPGGKERTEQEFKTLANRAGFACIRKAFWKTPGINTEPLVPRAEYNLGYVWSEGTKQQHMFVYFYTLRIFVVEYWR